MTDQGVLLSMFDRLRRNPSDRWLRTSTIKELKDTVIDHIDILLNTRRAKSSGLDEFPNLAGSILEYGLADFTHDGLNEESAQDALALAIQDAIRAFEPRLTDVTVHAFTEDGQLCFQVKADLGVEPISERVNFEAILERGSGRMVTGEMHSDA